MMFKLLLSVKKELLLLMRDIGGVIILFVMPLLLLIAVTMVQKGSFESILGSEVSVLLVDNDKDSVAQVIIDNLGKTGELVVIDSIDGQEVSEQRAKDLVHRGVYQLAIILPAKLTTNLQIHVQQNVDKVLAELDFSMDSVGEVPRIVDPGHVILYFDPATQAAFKTAIRMSIDKLVSNVESRAIYKTFQQELVANPNEDFSHQQFISFKEESAAASGHQEIPNAAQHNVPAWALFAIFFIVVPLSINIVKEKSQGTMVRITTSPTSYSIFVVGKTICYLLISLIQFYLMVLVGIFLFPVIGLQAFQVEDNLFFLSVIALFSGLAAIGLGVLIGTIASTQEQSAPFGATLTVVLAALGGIWVPVFVMPVLMQRLSMISPMNWGLSAFYDVLLRHAGLGDILPEIILLFLFFVLTLALAIFYDKKEKAV